MPGPVPIVPDPARGDRLGEERHRDQGDHDRDRTDAEGGRRDAGGSRRLATGRFLSRAGVGAHQEQDRHGQQHEGHDVDVAGYDDRRDERDGDESDCGQERHPSGQNDVVDDDREQAGAADDQHR